MGEDDGACRHTGDHSAWFEWEEDLPGEVAAFLVAQRAEAECWTDADPLDSQVYELADGFVIGMDVGDRERNCGLRTLRVDYGPAGLVYGEDETHQFDGALTPAQHEYGQLDRGGRSPAELGRAAAAWLRAQMVRPIELVEWERPGYWCRRYRLAGSGRWLAWTAADNRLRPDLGPPDRVSAVVTLAGKR